MLALRFGFWSAVISFVAAAGYSVVQCLQIVGLIRPPWDGILIYAFSLAIAWPFMLAVVALHRTSPEERKFWTTVALLFSVMYATYVSLMYVVQLGTAIPLALRGTPNPQFDVSRYSLFWALDGLGYICMGTATLFAAGAFAPGEKWVRRFFLANGLLTPIIGFVYFYPTFSIPLLMLAAPWIITAPGAILLLAFCFFGRSRAARKVQA